MVASMEIVKIGVRDKVVVDLRVGMDSPDDHEFQPRVHLDGNTIRFTNEGYSQEFANMELDDEALAAAERDRFVELRIKFSVTGMHGVLNDMHPYPKEGKGLKLANSSWKTIVPLL